eukprot:641159-Prymnesium_polylepis.1
MLRLPRAQESCMRAARRTRAYERRADHAATARCTPPPPRTPPRRARPPCAGCARACGAAPPRPRHRPRRPRRPRRRFSRPLPPPSQ